MVSGDCATTCSVTLLTMFIFVRRRSSRLIPGLRAMPEVFGLPIQAATVEHLQFMILGALIIFFLIVEPHGLARLWQIGKQKLRVWPYPY